MPLVRNLAVLLAVGALALSAAACGGGEETRSPEDVPPDAVALVGDEKVLKSDLEGLMAQAEQGYKAQKREFPKAGTPEYESLRNQALRYLVQRSQFEQEAAEMGIEVTDEDVDKRLDEVVKQVADGSSEKFQRQIKRQGLTDEQVRDNLRMQVLQEKIYEEVTGDIEVTDEDIEKYYDENKEQFTEPESREVRHILVDTKVRADRLHDRLENGANFAALAKRHSQDPASKDQGGKYQAVKGQSVPEFDKVAFELDEGELSEPVKTQFGWHIIQAMSPIEPADTTPLADVKDSIRDQLLQQKKNDAIMQWVKDVENEWEPRVVYAVGYAPPADETDEDDTAETEEEQ